MSAFFNKKNHRRNLSHKEIIDSVKISIEKNDKAIRDLDFLLLNLRSGLDTTIYAENVNTYEYLRFMCNEVDKMYKESLKRLGGKL